MYLVEPIRNGEYIYDGAVALAIQVHVLNKLNLDEDIIFPYCCKPKVQIGLFQNAEKEINHNYMKANDITLVRRDTGGGTVFLDEGAVNICLIMSGDNNIYGNFKKFYEPAVNILKDLGVAKVEQTGRNDLVVDGKKVSGAAMTIVNGKIYGGYTLLLDVNYDAIVNVLTPNRKKIESKGIDSVKSRVTSLREYLNEEYRNLSVVDFKDLYLCRLFDCERIEDIKRYELTEADWCEIDHLLCEKYQNWDWNYGKSPRYNYNRDARLGVGTVEFNLEVETGRITKAKIYGDFFGKGNVSDVEERLIGVRVKEEDLLEVLEGIDLAHYFGKVEARELVELILS